MEANKGGDDLTLKELKQYGTLKKEVAMLERKIEIMYKRKEKVPLVAGKVIGSSSDFPYTEVRTSVEMYDPVKEDALDRLIRAKENRLKEVSELVLVIEQYIASIPESSTRQIFELVFIDGATYEKVGDEIGYTKGRISQLISKQLKD